MTDIRRTHTMCGKLIVIFNATSSALCGRCKITLFEKGQGPNRQPVIGKLLTLTNPIIMHCFIDTFSDP